MKLFPTVHTCPFRGTDLDQDPDVSLNYDFDANTKQTYDTVCEYNCPLGARAIFCGATNNVVSDSEIEVRRRSLIRWGVQWLGKEMQ